MENEKFAACETKFKLFANHYREIQNYNGGRFISTNNPEHLWLEQQQHFPNIYDLTSDK
jgi:hypothetical protein